MLTRGGLKVVEFNCRFGDPETQAILPVLDSMDAGLLGFMAAVARGERIPPWHALWSVNRPAVTTVVAAAGYPEKPRTGDPITLPDALPDGVHLFHAGTALDAEGRLVTAGGRVLAVTAMADTFEQARALSREYAERVEFAGRQSARTSVGRARPSAPCGAARD
jgi:phosphoribosylamine--glycine ligase